MPTKLTKNEFIERVSQLNKGITILGDYVNSSTKIKAKCENGHVWYPTPRNLLHKNSNCIYCSGKKAYVGETDLWTTRPDIALLLKDKNDGYKYTSGSSKKLCFICPDCGSESFKTLGMVCANKFYCNVCSDGISYPNKFGRALLRQLVGDNYIPEWSPSWAGKYYYDNYFEYNGTKYVLEMDGAFHYKEYYNSNCSLDYIKHNDLKKDILAKNNGINMIRINCMPSTYESIKKHIMSSELNDIFDLSKIDWELCDLSAQKSLIVDVCNLYNKGIHDLNKIKDILKISLWAVQKYVKIGGNVGMCEYTPELSIKEGAEKRTTKVSIVNKNGDMLYSFSSIKSCIDEVKKTYGVNLNSPNIVKACQTHNPYKGFYFKYID